MLRRGLAALALLPVACTSAIAPTGGSASATVGGTVLDVSGNPIAGVAISSGTASTTSASDGSYSFPVAASQTAVVAFSATGFLASAYSVATTAGQSAELDPSLMPQAAAQPLDATHGGAVQGSRGSSLTAGPGVFVTASGTPVTGSVQVSLTPLTPGEPGEIGAYPGNMQAVDAQGNQVLLETHGVLDVTVTQNGQKLQIASGKTVAVTIPAAIVGAQPSSSSLWSFDLATALWKYEGTAAFSNGTYTAQLPHLSFWNIDCSNGSGAPVVCLMGKLLSCNGQPIYGAAITVTANDSSYSTSTEGSGEFCVALPPGGGAAGGAAPDSAGCEQSVSATSWNVHVKARNVDVTVVVAAPTQGTNNGQSVSSCQTMEAAAECLDLRNVGCVGDGGQLIQLDGGGSCPYWQGDAGPDAGGVAGVPSDPFAGSCAAPLASLFTCFNGGGGCSFDGDLDGGTFTDTYANGSKEVIQVAASDTGNSAQIQYFGSDGGLCGTVSTFGGAINFVIGGSLFTMLASGDSTTITCPDGGVLTLNDDQSNAAVGCAGNLGGGGGGGCAPKDGPGTPCMSDLDCGGPYQTTCCQDALLGSICVTTGSCGLYEDGGCNSMNPCTASGESCCNSLASTLGFDLCLPASACGSCGPASPCPNGGTCCTPSGSSQSVCVPLGTSCGSNCTSDGDCGGGESCCPEPFSSIEICEQGSCPAGTCTAGGGGCSVVADGCCVTNDTELYGACMPTPLPSYCVN